MEQSYKEKYEDILARLVKAKNDNDVCDERFCCVIDDIIPELAESEDEKVRKELTKHLKELSDWKEDEVIPIKNPSYYRQWATWLEKQGEHANFRNKIQVGDKVTRNEAGVLVNLSQLKRVAKPSEKQGEKKFEMKTAEESLGIDSDTYNKIVDECIFGEQKPKENKGNIGEISPNWSEKDEEYNGEDYGIDSLYHAQRILEKTLGKVDGYQTDDGILSHKCAITAVKKLYEQKSAWSEEDENTINNLLAICAGAKRYRQFAGCSQDDVVKYQNWLKSIKDRVLPQPKQEWSEEDEKMLGDIIKESDTKKIIVEIFGVRHRLVGDNSNKRFSCEKECSLHEVCKPLDDCIADDFIKLVPFKCHFEKEEICG